MENTQSSNKRIAKNTIMLYFRMILIMLVTLYTSRVVLSKLGIEDYGIHNVVGGVVAMFSFLNNSMATATQRFMTHTIGLRDFDRLKKVFSTSVSIHLIIGSLIIILAETLGLWFLNEKLVIPDVRMHAANWVYQMSILSFFVSIMQVPFHATLVSHENMSIYAYVSIVEVLLRLGIVYLLSFNGGDKLIIYSVLLLIVQIVTVTIYQMYCVRRYEECHFSFPRDKMLLKEMTSFAGWNLFGSLAWLLRGQGQNIILNLFFGPIVNAARGVCHQVQYAVCSFTQNFLVALNPQITKNYASGNINEMETLAYRGLKFSFYVLYILSLPLCLSIDYILSLWLKQVPEFTNTFIVLTFIDTLVAILFGSPLMTSMMATGKIKRYQIIVSSIILLYLPISYVSLKIGGTPYTVFYILIIISGLSGFVRLLFCKKQIGYSLRRYLKKVIIPVTIVVIISAPISIIINRLYLSEVNFINAFINSMTSFAVSGLAIWFIGINKYERIALINILLRRLKR